MKDDYRKFYGTFAGFGCHGVDTAKETNYCEIDNQVVDKYGIPVLRFNYHWGSDEIKQAKHMNETTLSVFKEMNGIPLLAPAGDSNNWGLSNPGKGIHEVGTVRMGDDAKKSAVNSYGQSHDCENLFVTDGSVFTQQAEKNPTWTILALSMRTAEYILHQKKNQTI